MSRNSSFALFCGLTFTWTGVSATLEAGNCGCDYQPACRTVEHVHRHVYCHRRHCGHYDSAPPVGMVVGSAPVAMPMAMPMAAYAPVAAAPMAMVAQAPTYAMQSAPQQAPLRSTCGSDSGMNAVFEQAMVKMMERALTGGMNGTGAAAPLSAAPSSSLDDRIAELDQKVSELTRLTEKVSDALVNQNARIRALEGK